MEFGVGPGKVCKFMQGTSRTFKRCWGSHQGRDLSSVRSVQLLSHVQLFATSTAACQACLQKSPQTYLLKLGSTLPAKLGLSHCTNIPSPRTWGNWGWWWWVTTIVTWVGAVLETDFQIFLILLAFWVRKPSAKSFLSCELQETKHEAIHLITFLWEKEMEVF